MMPILIIFLEIVITIIAINFLALIGMVVWAFIFNPEVVKNEKVSPKY